mgnify:CR=1 FL=1
MRSFRIYARWVSQNIGPGFVQRRHREFLQSVEQIILRLCATESREREQALCSAGVQLGHRLHLLDDSLKPTPGQVVLGWRHRGEIDPEQARRLWTLSERLLGLQ